MADLQQILQALRNAEASGNSADAQRLAQLAQQAKQQMAAPENTADDSLLTGIKNSAMRIGAGVADFFPTVNRALTGYENPRLFVDTGDDGFQLSDLKTARFIDEKDVPSNATNPFGFTGNEFDDATAFIKQKQAELNYQPKVSWQEVKDNPSATNILGFMGENAITSLPDMAAAMISAPAYFASYVAPIANERAKNDGGRQVTPEDLAYAAVASAGIAAAERFGAKGIFGKVAGNNAATRIGGAGIREMTTEAIQEPLEYAGGTVGTQKGFDPLEAVDRAAAGAVGGLGAGAGLRTANEIVAGGSRTAPEDQQAATNLANRMDAYAKDNKLNPKNVSNRQNTKGARALQDGVHVELSDEIQEAYDDLGKAIKTDRKNDTAEVKRLKRLAKSALRQAKNKVKNTVGKKEMDAVETLVGNTREGRNLINLMRESNELTTLVNRKLKGGVSRWTDLASPIDSNTGYNPKPLIEIPTRAALTGGIAMNTGGASLIPQAGIFLGGRAIDAVTGNRSIVNRFIEDNKGAGGLVNKAQTSISATETEREETKRNQQQKRRQNAKDAFDRNDPITGNPLKPSPQMQIADGVGIRTPQELKAVAEEMKQNPAYENLNEELTQTIESVEFGGRIDNLGDVIQAMAGYVGNQASPDTRVAPISPRIQQGIDDNRARLEQLRTNMQNDTELNDFDKQVLNDAFDQLKFDLGSDPVTAAEAYVRNAVAVARNKQKAAAYLNPYLERVRQQQSGKKSKELTSGEIISEETNAALFDPIDTAEYEDTTYYHGTPNVFKEFDPSMLGKTTGSDWMGTAPYSAKQGFWFTDDPQTAMSYADFGALHKPVNEAIDLASEAEMDDDFDRYEQLTREAEALEKEIINQPERGQTIIPVKVPKNLMVYDAEGNKWSDANDGITQAINKARNEGYDGLKVLNLSDTADYSIYRPATHVLVFNADKIRSKFAPQQNNNKDKPVLDIQNREEMDKIARTARGRILRDALDKMLMKAGEGVLKSRKKGDPIGTLAENFDNSKMLARELVKYLDPEGRETVSKVQVGMDGKGLSDEDIQAILPHLVRGMTFLKGSKAMDGGFLGQMRTVLIKGADGNQKVLKRMIDMVDIGEKLGREADAETMTAEMFFETLLHEIGHSVEAQTPLRELMANTKMLANRKDADAMQQIENIIRISKRRRKPHWDRLERKLAEGTLLSAQPMPTVNDLMTWDFNKWLEFTREGTQNIVDRGGDIEVQAERYRQLVTKDAYKAWEYLTAPYELAADLVAYYFADPVKLKKDFPLQAKMVRKAVNNSDISEYITFHTILGLIGAAGLQAILLGEDEEDKGVLSLGQGALSSAA